ncbi:MAG: response regulator, partial [Shewanella sp.]
MNILIIEDDRTSQLMLQNILSAYAVTLAGSGEQGLELIGECQPDLVILDINLPGIDGYEVCRQLRARQDTQTTPIIFLSSYQSLEDRLAAYGAGGNDYINKPFDVDELKLKVSQVQQQVQLRKSVNQDLRMSHQLVLGVQTSAAKIQSISRFIQASLFMHNMDTLTHCFFRIANEIELSCVLKIDTGNGIKLLSTNYNVSQLEDEILQMSGKIERIHSFGNDRAIFRWDHATLLAR